jgi:hypothetical protein
VEKSLIHDDDDDDDDDDDGEHLMHVQKYLWFPMNACHRVCLIFKAEDTLPSSVLAVPLPIHGNNLYQCSPETKENKVKWPTLPNSVVVVQKSKQLTIKQF